MRGQGHQVFVDELARFADRVVDPRVTAIARRTATPLRVVVRGRRGVGGRTVAHALDGGRSAAGISADVRVTSPAPDACVDVVVYVVAEVVKPEDTRAIADAGCPVVAVLNKADLVGSLSGSGDGPIAAARARCADLSALVGIPVEPMIGLLGVAPDDLDRDDALWAALSTLAAHPGAAACLDGSFAGFLAANAPVPAGVRQRLLESLDMFGTALAVAAIRGGGTPAQVRALLRRMSGVDEVLARIGALGAEVRYQRVLGAVAELEALAAGGGGLGERISGFLSSDDTVIARMAAAADMAGAAGLDPGDAGRLDVGRGPSAHLPRAVRWQRCGRSAASELHRACSADIARGSLRLWSRTRASLPGESR